MIFCPYVQAIIKMISSGSLNAPSSSGNVSNSNATTPQPIRRESLSSASPPVPIPGSSPSSCKRLALTSLSAYPFNLQMRATVVWEWRVVAAQHPLMHVKCTDGVSNCRVKGLDNRDHLKLEDVVILLMQALFDQTKLVICMVRQAFKIEVRQSQAPAQDTSEVLDRPQIFQFLIVPAITQTICWRKAQELRLEATPLPLLRFNKCW